MSHKVSYSNFFTPPRFLQMPAVSVQILENSIRYLTTKKTAYGLIPDQFGVAPLISGDIVKTLIDIRKKTGAKFVKFSLPEENTYIFKTKLPCLKSEEIRSILDFKLEENIPLTSKEAVFDYDLVKSSNNHSSEMDLIVSAAPIKNIEDFQTIFQSAGLIPIFFSPESSNIAKSIVKEGNEQAIVIVNIKENKIILSLVVSGSIYQTSSLTFGGANFTNLLAKYYKISIAEADKLKFDKLYSDNPESFEIFSQIINTVSAIQDEIGKFISYCNEKGDLAGKVDHVVICGRDAMIVGLASHLSAGLDLPVEVTNIWVNNFTFDDYVPEISRLESLDYAALNGLNLF
jgi:type IV pilus assembly protein PilM